MLKKKKKEKTCVLCVDREYNLYMSLSKVPRTNETNLVAKMMYHGDVITGREVCSEFLRVYNDLLQRVRFITFILKIGILYQRKIHMCEC